MIASITGELRHVDEEGAHCHVAAGPLVYELLVPASDAVELEQRLGREITLYTVLYLQGDGNNFAPQLIGFLRRDDKQFFEVFTTVKGIGPRTALRALTVPVGEIAAAIDAKDAKFLATLKGIGKRTAEVIVAELAGKVDAFVSLRGRERALGIQTDAKVRRTQAENDAIESLVVLGERRLDAESLLEKAKALEPDAKTSNQLVTVMLRLRGAR
jgi:Holliday junction DNA helicase RuvA